MRALGLPLLVALLLVLAGVGVPVSAPADTTQAEFDENVEDIRAMHIERPSAKGTEVSSESSDPGETTAPDPSTEMLNPWDEEVVTVGMGDEPESWTEAEIAAVESAIHYWNAREDIYTDHQVTFAFVGNSTRPDVQVQFVPYIDNCGVSADSAVTLACAPRYDEGEEATVPTSIRVREGRDEAALARSVKHEFGHILGLRHGEEPMPLMAETTAWEPRATVMNASERRYPWHDRVLSVSIEQDGTYRQGALRAHVKEALAYYENADSRWDGPSPEFVLVQDPARADIRLRVSRTDECDVGGGYCWTAAGEQLDKDEAIEYYTRFNATFGSLDARYLSWYAGRVIGYAIGADDESELPATFADPRKADDRWFDHETRSRYGSIAAKRSAIDQPQAEEDDDTSG